MDKDQIGKIMRKSVCKKRVLGKKKTLRTNIRKDDDQSEYVRRV